MKRDRKLYQELEISSAIRSTVTLKKPLLIGKYFNTIPSRPLFYLVALWHNSLV